jgi:hypothetical protein
MRFSPLSFVLGLVAAAALPVLSRAFRPIAVEVTAAGMGFVEDARRIAAEQLEALEDIVAEARARHEELADAAQQDLEASELESESNPAADADEPSVTPSARRRTDRSRTRTS